MADQHFYRPLRSVNGELLKYAGLCTERNRDWFPKDCTPDDVYLSGVVIAPTYLGDKIPANTEGLGEVYGV